MMSIDHTRYCEWPTRSWIASIYSGIGGTFYYLLYLARLTSSQIRAR